jgi:MFS transporter, DHA3 family, macrolide efflux protein
MEVLSGGVFCEVGGKARFTENFLIFRNRDFTLYFLGQFISRIGNSVNILALVWFAHILTNSTFQMSLVLVAGVIPRVLLAPVTGVLVDRWPKRRTMMITDMVRCIIVASLAASVFTHTANIPVLIVFNILMSVFSTASTPGQRVLQRHIVDEGQLLQANSLLQSSLNISQIAGPALAGALIGWVGVGPAFVVDAATFAASFLTLMAITVREPDVVKKPLTGISIVRDIKMGTKVTMEIPTMRVLLPFMLLFNFLLSAVENLLIVQYVANVLHRGPDIVGLLGAVFGMLGSVFEGVTPVSQLVFGAIAAALPVGGVMTTIGILAALAGCGFLLNPALKQPVTAETPSADLS